MAVPFEFLVGFTAIFVFWSLYLGSRLSENNEFPPRKPKSTRPQRRRYTKNVEMPSSPEAELKNSTLGKRKLSTGNSQTIGPAKKKSNRPTSDVRSKTTMPAASKVIEDDVEDANYEEQSAEVKTESLPAKTQSPPAKTQSPPAKTQSPPAKPESPPAKPESPPAKPESPPAKTESPPAKGPNAFQELMAPKAKKAVVPVPPPIQKTTIPSVLRLQNPNSRGGDNRRNDLGLYTSNPSTIPQNLRIYENKDFVAIKDLFPKSSVHMLLLFKSPNNVVHPFHFFEDPDVLARTREEIKKLGHIAAKELARKHGKFSAQDKAKLQVLRGEITGQDIPEGRDWESEIMVGIHARPSMNHVHVHVLSRDRYSDYMSHRKHYNSFNTPFFVNMDDFPLAEDDPRWDSNETNSFIRSEFRCWRCGRGNFRNFPDLKQHLAEEFMKWRAE